MALRIVAFVAIACLSGSNAARTSLRATLQAEELSHLQVLIANTTKALKESQAATTAEKKAPAVEKKTPEADKKPEEKLSAKPKPAFPQHVTKERQAVIIKQLSAEEDILDKNLKAIKAEEKADKSKEKITSEKHLESMMKGKDAAMLKNFDDFTKRANAKAAVGAQDVLSKLKHMIHFIKKGALTGNNTQAAAGLDDVLKDMGSMVR